MRMIFFIKKNTIVHRADSVTWNPHKLMGALLQCSTIHFKEDVSHFQIDYYSSYRNCKNRSTCMCILANKSTSRDPVDGNSCLL